MIPTVITDTRPGSAMVELSLSVELQPESESGLLRALTVLHRRRCRVLEARYGTAGGAERLTLRVQAPPRHAHCVQAWLSSLVDVRTVGSGVVAPVYPGRGEEQRDHGTAELSRARRR